MERGLAVETTLITMLGAALGITINLLGAAIFSALSRIDGLQRGFGVMRAELVEARAESRASHDDLAARIDGVNQALAEHLRQHAA